MITLQELVLNIENNADAVLLYETVREMNEGALEPLQVRFSSDMKTVEIRGTRVKLYSFVDVLYARQLRNILNKEEVPTRPTLREMFVEQTQTAVQRTQV